MSESVLCSFDSSERDAGSIGAAAGSKSAATWPGSSVPRGENIEEHPDEKAEYKEERAAIEFAENRR